MTRNLQILHHLKFAQSTTQSIADLLNCPLHEAELLLKLMHRTKLVTCSTISTLTFWRITPSGHAHTL